MYCITAAYPAGEGSTFDFGYYLKNHIPMAMELLGERAVRAEVRKGVAGPGGSPAPYICVASIFITTPAAFHDALAHHGARILGDIPNYTNIQPIIQVDEVLE